MFIREITENEKDRWNNFVSSHPKGHIFQSYEWGKLKAKTNRIVRWIPIYLVVEEGKQIKAAALILKLKIPLLRWCIFYAPRGPVLDYQDRKTFDFLLEEIKKMARLHKAIFFQIDPDIPVGNIEVKKYLEQRGFICLLKYGVVGITQPKRVFRLGLLEKSTEELFADMDKKHRQYVRLAKRKGIKVEQDNTLKGLESFYNIFRETSSRKNFYIHSFKYCRNLFGKFSSNQEVKIFLAKHNNKSVAARLVLVLGNKCWDMYAGSSSNYRSLRASYLLVWEIIKWVKTKGCIWFDFRGADSPDPNDSLHGVYRFKKGFGPEYIEFIGDYYLVFSQSCFRLWNAGMALLKYGTRIYKKVNKFNAFFRNKRV